MDFLNDLIGIVLHVDKNLITLVDTFGIWTYVILFLVIFCETGLIIFPFLPGDSLLFAAGAVAGTTGNLNVFWLIVVILLAAILGNTVNFSVSRYFGHKFVENGKIKYIKQEHIDKTHRFYEKHGAKAIILSRFLPIFRTFVPFVAGVGQMDAKKFTLYNVIGALLWVPPLILTGWMLGSNEFVQKNFSFIVLGLIVVTIIPTLVAGLSKSFGK
ncbi:MAG: DedA family protein [Saprospiraceae bacterium]|nr:DedA family protein [Saprospiraceae bacterium]